MSVLLLALAVTNVALGAMTGTTWQFVLGILLGVVALAAHRVNARRP